MIGKTGSKVDRVGDYMTELGKLSSHAPPIVPFSIVAPASSYFQSIGRLFHVNATFTQSLSVRS